LKVILTKKKKTAILAHKGKRIVKIHSLTDVLPIDRPMDNIDTNR